jgi:hypothetical protein
VSRMACLVSRLAYLVYVCRQCIHLCVDSVSTETARLSVNTLATTCEHTCTHGCEHTYNTQRPPLSPAHRGIVPVVEEGGSEGGDVEVEDWLRGSAGERWRRP